MRATNKNYFYSFAGLLTVFVLMLVLCAPVNIYGATGGNAGKKAAAIEGWNEGATLSAITDYVKAVCDKDSADYIPEEDRIAVFDMDGTIIGEKFPIYFEWMMYCDRVLNDPDYTPTKKQVRVAKTVLTAGKTKVLPHDLEANENKCFGKVFAGMTKEDFLAYVDNWLNTKADRFENLKVRDAFFKPMVELIKYLRENNFTLYIVSGTDRDVTRVMINGKLDIDASHVIGSDYYTVSSGQNGKGYLDYQYADGDSIVRDSKPIIKNVKMSKVVQIAQEIGKQPVLAFGNSSGDESMLAYVTDNNKYRAEAFCVVPDDDVREIYLPDKVKSLTSMCSSQGWHVISMKNDFAELYAEGVVMNESNTPWVDGLLKK